MEVTLKNCRQVRNNGGGQSVLTVATKRRSTKTHNNNRKQTRPIIETTSTRLSQPYSTAVEQQPLCSFMPIDSKYTEHRLKTIGDQLTQLVRFSSNSTLPNSVVDQKSSIVQHANENHLNSRVQTVLRIYWKLIKLGPLCFHIQSTPMLNRNIFNILTSRQQVLCYIENLNGYCDSINLLRLILKSETMINTMIAYEKIVEYMRTTEV